jgi:hypothetical protein
VTCKKVSGARTFINLRQASSRVVTVDSVSDDSPLAGLVFPADIIVSVCGSPATKAESVAAKLKEASSVSLQVVSPHEEALGGTAESLFLQPALLELELEKDKKTGLPRVASSRAAGAAARSTSTRDIDVGGGQHLLLRPGDLVVAVGANDGMMYAVDSPKAVHERLREATSVGEGAIVEVRVVRDPDSAREADEPSMHEPRAVTRCVARDAVRRSSPPPTGDDSGRSSPSSSLGEMER